MSVIDTDAAPLLEEDFSGGGLSGWTIVDQGIYDAPSAWSAATGLLVQSRNIYATPDAASSLDKLGTYAV